MLAQKADVAATAEHSENTAAKTNDKRLATNDRILKGTNDPPTRNLRHL
jgi:hypothetical protein